LIGFFLTQNVQNKSPNSPYFYGRPHFLGGFGLF
jgi:hypothetical protein